MVALVTTMETARSKFEASRAPSSRSMMTSVAFHALVLLLLLLVPAKHILRSDARSREIDVVFYRAPKVQVPAPALPLLARREKIAEGSLPGAPAPALHPKPDAPAGPDGPGRPELPPGPEDGSAVEQQQQRAGRTGILAFKEKFASLAQDKLAPRLGADARYGAADDVGRSSSP